MGYDAHVTAYKEIQHRRSKSKGGKKDKKGSKGPKVTERNNWSEVTSKEVRTALVPVLKDSAWPKYLASFSSFQGYHDCVRRIHLANEPWENVSEERQQLVLRAIRCVTSQGLDAWELVLKIRLVAKLTSARVEEMVAKQSELEQGAFITEVKEFFSVLDMSRYFTKANLNYLADVKDDTFTVSLVVCLLWFSVVFCFCLF
jgi:hypothetical protein